MTDNTAASLTDLLKQAQKAFPVSPLVTPRAEHFWEAQDRILKETEAFSKNWFQRRHAATQSALEAARKSGAASGDMTEGLRIMSEWQRHSLERLSEDFREWMAMSARCMGQMTAAEVESEKDAMAAVEASVKTARSATGSRHATPV